MGISKGIGYGKIWDKVYLGRRNDEKGMWVGDKEDITSDFLFVLSQFIPPNTTRTVTGGDQESLYIHAVNTKEDITKVIKHLQKIVDEKDE